MKYTTLALLAMAFAVACSAQTSTVYAYPGDTIFIKDNEDHSNTFNGHKEDDPHYLSKIDQKNLVRAMEILARYAPDDSTFLDNTQWINLSGTFGTAGSIMLGSGSILEHTKAQALREEAERKKAGAARLDKERAEIKWARSILADAKKNLERMGA